MFFTRKQKDKLSHDLSMFADYLHRNRNQAGSAMHKSIQEFKSLSQEKELDNLSDSTGQFHSEMFGRLYEDSEQLDTPSAQWASDIHDVLDELPEFARLQRMTQRDADLASLSTAYVMDHFKDTIFETAQAIKEQAEQNQRDNDKDGGDRPTDQNTMGLADLSQDKQDSIESGAIQQSVTMDKVIQDVSDAKQAMKALSIGEGKNNEKSTDRQEFIRKTMQDRQMKLILEMLGRLKKSMQSQPGMVKETPKVRSYEIHQDRAPKELTRERMLACHDDTWDQYCFRFATRKQWKRKKENGEENVGKGPITICLDISSSMQGTAIDWAKSFVLALYGIAKDENRQVKMCTYNRQLQDTNFDLSKGSNYVSLLNKIVSINAYGGTSFNPPLQWASNNVQDKGDIIFITDGESSISGHVFHHMKNRLDETGARLFSVYIGSNYNRQLRSLSPLEIDLQDVMSKESDEKVGSLLRTIKS